MLLLFPLFSFSEDSASEKYCFPSSQAARLAQNKFSAIQVGSDVATLDEGCLVVQMRPHRRELIQRFILSSVPAGSVAFSSAEIRREPCKLLVEKITETNKDTLNAGVNQQTFGATQTKSNGSSSEIMQIDTLENFKLSVDQNEINGTCRYITPDRYEVVIEVRKNPKPVLPVNLPPGTVVIQNTPPPDQNTSVLKTELQLTRGQKVELGSLIENLEDKNHDINISPHLKVGTKQQKSLSKVFLSLK